MAPKWGKNVCLVQFTTENQPFAHCCAILGLCFIFLARGGLGALVASWLLGLGRNCKVLQVLQHANTIGCSHPRNLKHHHQSGHEVDARDVLPLFALKTYDPPTRMPQNAPKKYNRSKIG
eukprot:2637486-Amphidinium_carterae.1